MRTYRVAGLPTAMTADELAARLRGCFDCYSPLRLHARADGTVTLHCSRSVACAASWATTRAGRIYRDGGDHEDRFYASGFAGGRLDEQRAVVTEEVGDDHLQELREAWA